MLKVFGDNCLFHLNVNKWVEEFRSACIKVSDEQRRGGPVEVGTSSLESRFHSLIKD